MALRTINSDYQAFEFITNSLRQLQLWGSLLDFKHEIQTGLAEHLILMREGAIHQRTVTPPRRFVYQCTLIGDRVGDRYRALGDAVNEDPTGRLIDPRFGSVRVICEGLQAAEKPEQAVDEVLFSISFKESGLRTAPRENAGSIAAGAIAQAQTFTSALPASFSTWSAAARSAVITLGNQITAVRTVADSIETHRQLAAVADSTAAIQRQARVQGRYDIYAQAAVTYRQAALAVQANDAQRPRSLRYPVPADMSLARLCAALYGGARARAMCAEILAVNRVSNPALIPAGTQLLIPDPEAIRGAA